MATPEDRLGIKPNELAPIAEYMANEMNGNSNSGDARRMRELNSYSAIEGIKQWQKLPFWRQLFGLGISPQQCMEMEFNSRTAALVSWGLKVRQNGEWDHKPKISARFHPRVANGEQHWHLYGDTLYYYDVWSNVHYGYVGRAAGFSDPVLLDGAGLEQIGSNLARFSKPQRDTATQGLRAFDDPHDRAAIEIGIKLYRISPKSISASIILKAIVNSDAVEKKRFLGSGSR